MILFFVTELPLSTPITPSPGPHELLAAHSVGEGSAECNTKGKAVVPRGAA